MLLLSPYIIKLNIAYSVAKGFPEFTCSMRLPTHWLPRSAINNSIRVETVWCPDGSSTINIIPDCEAHFSLQWCCMCVPPSNPPPSSASQGTIFGLCSILVSNRGALERWVLHLHVKTSPGSGCKRPNLEWQSSARDSWSTKEAWLSSSSQSPAAPLTHSTSIQQTDAQEREGNAATCTLACSTEKLMIRLHSFENHRVFVINFSIINMLLKYCYDSAP